MYCTTQIKSCDWGEKATLDKLIDEVSGSIIQG